MGRRGGGGGGGPSKGMKEEKRGGSGEEDEVDYSMTVQAVWPPSTIKCPPVQYDDSSDA